jgi:hypothetical protein
MKTRYTAALPVGVLLVLGLVLPTGEAVSQQAGPTFHRYLVSEKSTKAAPHGPQNRCCQVCGVGRRQARILVF